MNFFLIIGTLCVTQVVIIEARKSKLIISPYEMAKILQEIEGFSDLFFLRDIVCISKKNKSQKTVHDCYKDKQNDHKQKITSLSNLLTEVGNTLMKKLTQTYKQSVLNFQSSAHRLIQAMSLHQSKIIGEIESNNFTKTKSVIIEAKLSTDSYFIELFMHLLDIYHTGGYIQSSVQTDRVEKFINDTKSYCEKLLKDVKICLEIN